MTGLDGDGDKVTYYLNERREFPVDHIGWATSEALIDRNTNPGIGCPIIPWIEVNETSGVVTTRPCGRRGVWTAQVRIIGKEVDFSALKGQGNFFSEGSGRVGCS